MSDCGPGQHSAQVWTPASRCRDCGHRISSAATVPIATRRMRPDYWLFEVLARWLARHPVQELRLR